MSAIHGLEARASDDAGIAASVGLGEILSSIVRRLSSPLRFGVARQSRNSAMKQDNGFELEACVVVVVVVVTARDESDGAYSLPLGRGP